MFTRRRADYAALWARACSSWQRFGRGRTIDRGRLAIIGETNREVTVPAIIALGLAAAIAAKAAIGTTR
jgi:hypothetical protein